MDSIAASRDSRVRSRPARWSASTTTLAPVTPHMLYGVSLTSGAMAASLAFHGSRSGEFGSRVKVTV